MRRPFPFPFPMALALSLTLHLLVLAWPGRGVPPANDALTLRSLDASLRSLAAAPAVAAPKKPVPRSPAAPESRPAPAQALPGQEQAEAADENAASADAVRSDAAGAADAVQSNAAGAADAVQSNAAGAADAVPPAPTLSTASAGFATAFANAWPRRGLIRFSVTRGEGGFVIGQAEHRWEHDGSSYRIRAQTTTTGIAALFKPAAVAQESRGIFVATGLQPLEFRNERDGKLKLRLQFDPEQGRIAADGGGGQAMSGPAHDLLSLFYQLGALLERPAEADAPVVTVTTGRRLVQHSLARVETIPLETPFGTRTVLHLKLPAAAGTTPDESTEVWLDVASRLPLKIRYRDRKGEVFDQTATAVELEQPQ